MTKDMTKAFASWPSVRKVKLLLGVACRTPGKHGVTQVRNNPKMIVIEAQGKLHIGFPAREKLLGK